MQGFNSSALRRVLAAALVIGVGTTAHADVLTNADVERMVAARVAPQTIVLTIKAAAARFDTSAEAIIALSRNGVPEPVIDAMIASKSDQTGGAATAVMSADEIIMLDGDRRISLLYTIGGTRNAERALGYGGSATYAVLPGVTAQHRTSIRKPTFLMMVPDGASPHGLLTLARFEPRRNGTREVSVGSRVKFSSSTGIHPDRVVPMNYEPLPEQSQAPSGYTIYRASPRNDLVPGEYAFAPATQGQRSGENVLLRLMAASSAGDGRYYDFGVD
ncbi:hypothetical protein H4O09_08400 [Stenotrophomonas sp. W1S232]|uniref:Uncharacterized protein n=1 Tax=Stenotrophomonas koreensis TaxID=266128 RepID=A0A7W3V066_9GAMM|nr:hypothetical protein [Stenotrophomonas koreensis]MBB1117068.1 hypothetical protein [Stenotrophomonas koreensis]